MKSEAATPSRRNVGFDAISESASGYFSWMMRSTFLAVRGGAFGLSTIME